MATPLKIQVQRNDAPLVEQVFDREIIKIGRLASAHLRLDDPKVSRIHAVIESQSDGLGYSLIDMGSSDGTFLNGEKVSKGKLKDGDEIRIGDTRLKLSIGGAIPKAAAAPMPPVPPTEDPNVHVVTQTLRPADPSAVPPPPPVSIIPAPPMAMVAAPMAPMAVAPAMAAMPAMPMAPMPMAPVGYAPVADPAAYPGYAAPGYAAPSGYPYPIAEVANPTYDPAYEQASATYADASAWGTVPNNLAAENVPEKERVLEVKLVWGNTVLDTVSATNKPVITAGDEPKVVGAGPARKIERCDLEIPTQGLPLRSYPIAVSTHPEGCAYAVNIHESFTGHLERPDGSWTPIEELVKTGMEKSDVPESYSFPLQAEQTLYLHHGHLSFQLRYVRQNPLPPSSLFERLNYVWVNTLILVVFFHILAIASFVLTPKVTKDLEEELFKNPNRFANIRLTAEQKRKQSLLSKLKEGAQAAKAKGNEGKAGKKDYKEKSQGRMAVKAIKPDDKEIAKSTLAKLFGAQGNTGASYIFGSGGLGGELKGALGGVTGAEIGDASGLGGLGTRGAGPGGGGLSMNSVGLGALGTAGRGGGGDGSYGTGVGDLGKKADRDVNISAGSPIIMGSLDKELIRRVIEQHKAQIRYCYEKELARSPGLFGKINVQWTIEANGSVRDSKVADSTMANDEVGRCITQKIRSWVFPKPKGGGIVIVKYPFVFKTSG